MTYDNSTSSTITASDGNGRTISSPPGIRVIKSQSELDDIYQRQHERGLLAVLGRRHPDLARDIFRKILDENLAEPR